MFLAGIQSFDKLRMHGEPAELWIPAFAGMTSFIKE
jgi:hypothetical protein